MTQIVHRMLENDDRARTVLAVIGIGAGATRTQMFVSARGLISSGPSFRA